MVRAFLGLFTLLLSLLLFAILIRIWPLSAPADYEFWNKVCEYPICKCPVCNEMAFEHRLLIIVMLSGALGSAIHTATSFATYVGNKSFASSWGWWYVLRIPIGMGLAFVLYLALRGGFFTPVSGNANAQDVVNPFGFAAIGALAGMFSKQATDKLKEIFDGIFRTEEDARRLDKLDIGKPTINTVTPSEITAGSTGVKLTVMGTGFSPATKIHIGGRETATEFVDQTKIACLLDDSDTATKRTLEVRLTSSVAGKEVSLTSSVNVN